MNPPTILIVDDEPHMRRLIEYTLRKNGPARFIFAEDGIEALAIVSREKVDLVTMDQCMGEMNGLDTLLRLKADPATADIPVIMISGHGSFHLDFNAKTLGAFAVLAKPYSPTLLMAEALNALQSPTTHTAAT